MKINQNGFWENPTSEGHGVDKGLAKAITELLKDWGAESVCDWGCGTGYYTEEIKKGGISCVGIDGNPFTKNFAGDYFVADLTSIEEVDDVLRYSEHFDWSICLEVGEHIPQSLEDNFIYNLTHYTRNGIILSWAVPGQGGDGHVNCKTNQEVVDIMQDKGFKLDLYNSSRLRDSAAKYPTPCYWFRSTILIFHKI